MKRLIIILALFGALVSCKNSESDDNNTAKLHASPPGTKRGVGYDFRTLKAPGDKNQSTVYTGKDMELLMSGTVGIRWFYNWGVAGNENIVETEARDRGLEFVPMTWNGQYTENNYKNYVKRNPGTKYLLAFNEPNFRHQANMTPEEAAKAWPKLRTLAKEANLKIISPAMNYSGGGESNGWNDPTAWLDEFRRLIGEKAWNEIEGIAVHLYAWWPNVVDMNIYRKYGKKLWLTEFCGWEDLQKRTPSPELQAWYLSQAVVYLEADPLVARYAWYLPKGHVAATNPPTGSAGVNPFHNLITEVNEGTTPELTDLGIIYTNIPSLDKGVWYSAGDTIDASQFMNSNLAEAAQTGKWSDSVLFRPVTDTDKSSGALEIYEFGKNMWVEYQIDVKTATTYTLTVRYNAAANAALIAKFDGNADKEKTLNSGGAWDTQTIDLGNIEAGKHTLRLRINSGKCALNWLKVE